MHFFDIASKYHQIFDSISMLFRWYVEKMYFNSISMLFNGISKMHQNFNAIQCIFDGILILFNGMSKKHQNFNANSMHFRCYFRWYVEKMHFDAFRCIVNGMSKKYRNTIEQNRISIHRKSIKNASN